MKVWRRAFLAALEYEGNISRACRACRPHVGRRTVYDLIEADPLGFAQEVQTALNRWAVTEEERRLRHILRAS